MSGIDGGLRERGKARRREAILRAAMTLFAEKGFEHATTADVAQAAEVSARTVTLYFPSKQELALAHFTDFADRLAAAASGTVIGELLSSPSPGHVAAAAMRAKKPIDLMQRTLPLIARAATKAGVDRLVVVSAFGVGDTAAKASPFARLIYRTLVAKIFKDKELSEQVLPGSGLNWTTVYPVNLKDAPAAPSSAIKNLEDVASVPGLPTLPFANAASALLKITGDLSLSGQRVLVTREKRWRQDQRLVAASRKSG